MRWTLLFFSLTTWVHSAVTYAGMTIECDSGCGDFDDPDVEQIVEIFTETVHKVFRHCVVLDEALQLRPITPWNKEDADDDQYLVWDWRKANGFWPARTALEDLAHQPPMISFQISEYPQFLESTLALQNDIHFLYYTAPRLRLKTYQHLLTNLQNIDQPEYGAVDIVDGGLLELYNYGTSTSSSQKIADLIQSVQYQIDQESDLSGADREYEENKIIVEQAIQNMDALFKEMFIWCLENHQLEGITFHEAIENLIAGDYDRAIRQIQLLIDLSEQQKLGNEVLAKLFFLKGEMQAEYGLYAEAVIGLTTAIHKNPEMKEAYFERAAAYFELGQFERAIEDYLASGIRPTYFESSTQLGLGITAGIIIGAKDATLEFIPTMLGTVKGLGAGIWALLKSPVAASQEFVNAAILCVEYVRSHAAYESIQDMVPEFKELVQNYERLDDFQKGKLIGHVIGKYGMDILLAKQSVTFIKAYQNLKKANKTLTLDALVSSGEAQTLLAETGQRWSNIHIEAIRKGEVKITGAKQGKHIVGHRNYEELTSNGKHPSIFSHPDPQKLLTEYGGTGIKADDSLEKVAGMAGYKELVDFKQVIGYAIEEKTQIVTETTFGKIHYAKDGAHIVPFIKR